MKQNSAFTCHESTEIGKKDEKEAQVEAIGNVNAKNRHMRKTLTDRTLRNNFLRKIKQVTRSQICSNCHESRIYTNLDKGKISDDGKYYCRRCCRENSRYRQQFNVNTGLIPCAVPKELCGLTPVEEMLIARVTPSMSIFTKKGGHTHLKGHVRAIHQDIKPLLFELPAIPEEIDYFFVKKISGNGSILHRVRRAKVYNALKWLLENNELYKGTVTISETKLNSLPVDGYLDAENFANSLEKVCFSLIL